MMGLSQFIVLHLQFDLVHLKFMDTSMRRFPGLPWMQSRQFSAQLLFRIFTQLRGC